MYKYKLKLFTKEETFKPKLKIKPICITICTILDNNIKYV